MLNERTNYITLFSCLDQLRTTNCKSCTLRNFHRRNVERSYLLDYTERNDQQNSGQNELEFLRSAEKKVKDLDLAVHTELKLIRDGRNAGRCVDKIIRIRAHHYAKTNSHPPPLSSSINSWHQPGPLTSVPFFSSFLLS